MENDEKYLKILRLIGKNLKSARLKAGLTQEEIAEMSGFHVRYYQRLEAGDQSPNLLTLYRATSCLKIGIEDLFKK